MYDKHFDYTRICFKKNNSDEAIRNISTVQQTVLALLLILKNLFFTRKHHLNNFKMDVVFLQLFRANNLIFLLFFCEQYICRKIPNLFKIRYCKNTILHCSMNSTICLYIINFKSIGRII